MEDQAQMKSTFSYRELGTQIALTQAGIAREVLLYTGPSVLQNHGSLPQDLKMPLVTLQASPAWLSPMGNGFWTLYQLGHAP